MNKHPSNVYHLLPLVTSVIMVTVSKPRPPCTHTYSNPTATPHTEHHHHRHHVGHCHHTVQLAVCTYSYVCTLVNVMLWSLPLRHAHGTRIDSASWQKHSKWKRPIFVNVLLCDSLNNLSLSHMSKLVSQGKHHQWKLQRVVTTTSASASGSSICTSWWQTDEKLQSQA